MLWGHQHEDKKWLLQTRDRDGWTCLHHYLSLPDPSPAAAAWIAAALALPGVAALREAALRELASAAPSAELELFRGDTDAAQVGKSDRLMLLLVWQHS